MDRRSFLIRALATLAAAQMPAVAQARILTASRPHRFAARGRPVVKAWAVSSPLTSGQDDLASNGCGLMFGQRPNAELRIIAVGEEAERFTESLAHASRPVIHLEPAQVASLTEADAVFWVCGGDVSPQERHIASGLALMSPETVQIAVFPNFGAAPSSASAFRLFDDLHSANVTMLTDFAAKSMSRPRAIGEGMLGMIGLLLKRSLHGFDFSDFRSVTGHGGLGGIVHWPLLEADVAIPDAVARDLDRLAGARSVLAWVRVGDDLALAHLERLCLDVAERCHSLADLTLGICAIPKLSSGSPGEAGLCSACWVGAAN